jgi:hypothetical protein
MTDFSNCVADQDHTTAPVGMVGNCTFKCNKAARPCQNGDGFCPTNCTRPQDDDCKSPLGQSCVLGSECANGFCTDGVCCAESCTAICHQCQAGSGACVPLDQQDDFGPNSCTGPTTCSNGQCKLKNLQPCTDPSQCISGICELSKCRPFSCHADQQWTPDDQCKTKNGQTCVPEWPCVNDYCDYATNKCVAMCSATTTTSPSGDKPNPPEPPGTCKLINGQDCTSNLACASGFCQCNILPSCPRRMCAP